MEVLKEVLIGNKYQHKENGNLYQVMGFNLGKVGQNAWVEFAEYVQLGSDLKYSREVSDFIVKFKDAPAGLEFVNEKGRIIPGFYKETYYNEKDVKIIETIIYRMVTEITTTSIIIPKPKGCEKPIFRLFHDETRGVTSDQFIIAEIEEIPAKLFRQMWDQLIEEMDNKYDTLDEEIITGS